jgi:hypothetical protein
MGSKSGAEWSIARSVRRGSKRGAVPPIALEPLNEKDKINSATNGPTMIQRGMREFMCVLLEGVVMALAYAGLVASVTST